MCFSKQLTKRVFHFENKKKLFFFFFPKKQENENRKRKQLPNMALVFPHVWLGGWKSESMEKLFYLVEKKNGMIENVICLNLFHAFIT